MMSSVPFVIENVPGAPLRCSVMLCGTMFGIKTLRHRIFELPPEILILTPPCKHGGTVKNGDYFCVVGGSSTQMSEAPYANKAQCSMAMGIDWMTRKEMTQAVPPAYTEFIGRHLIDILRLGGDNSGCNPEEDTDNTCQAG